MYLIEQGNAVFTLYIVFNYLQQFPALIWVNNFKHSYSLMAKYISSMMYI